MISFWKLFLCQVAVSTFVPQVSAHCSYQSISPNSFISGTDIFCFSVPEASGVGTSPCAFKALSTVSVALNSSGTLAPYNDFQTHDNGDGTLNINLFSKTSYSNHVDKETTIEDQTIADVFTCYAVDGMVMPANIYVNLLAENTQRPTFSSGTYNFVGVPQTLTPGVDITNQGYGNPITVTDTDNNFGAGNYDGAIIEFEIQGGSADWSVTAVAESTVWPYTYQAAITATKPLTQTQYQLVLIARNADGNLDQESTANVIISLTA